MKYNKSYDGEDFEKYLAYLNTIRPKLSQNLFDFVSNPNRHDFSEQSLHDSWVKSFESFCDFDADKTDIVLTLLGANFDREFKLTFQNVSQYKISQQACDMFRDLITYEIGVAQDGDEEEVVFRAVFAGEENEIEIYSETIDIAEYIK